MTGGDSAVFRLEPALGSEPMLAPGTRATTLPHDWARQLNDPLAWTGADLSDETAFTVVLSAEDVHELEHSLATFKDQELDGGDISHLNFPLPSLATRLRKLALELHRGRGFFILRGLDPKKYTPEDNALLFLGISSYIGGKRARQNVDGDMFTHIRESKTMKESQYDRPARDSKLALAFHTDSFCDIVALQTRGRGLRGGRHTIASTWNICRKLAIVRPDVLEVLANPEWKFDVRTPHHAAGQRSLLYNHGGRSILHFTREPLIGLDERCQTKIPTEVTLQQREALDLVEAMASADQLALSLQSGDLLFLNNFAVLHSREAFEDSDENERYLVRLWLKSESLAWKLPPSLADGNLSLFNAWPDEMRWNIRPTTKKKFRIGDLFSP